MSLLGPKRINEEFKFTIPNCWVQIYNELLGDLLEAAAIPPPLHWSVCSTALDSTELSESLDTDSAIQGFVAAQAFFPLAACSVCALLHWLHDAALWKACKVMIFGNVASSYTEMLPFISLAVY